MAVVEESLRKQLEQEEKERLDRFARAWEAYNGDHPDALLPTEEGIDHNLPINLSRLVVKKGVSYLVGRRLEFEILGADRTSNAEGKVTKQNAEADAEDYLERVLRANRRPRLLRNFATNGAVCGHSFMKIVPPAEGRETEDFPKIRVVDPAFVVPYWEPDDYEDVYRYVITYTGLDRDDRPIVIRQDIEKVETKENDSGISWVIRDMEAERDSSTGEGSRLLRRPADTFETIRETVWNFPFAPIIENQNLPRANEFWGESDLEKDVIDLNYGLNVLSANMNRVVHIYGNPRTVISGVNAEELAQIDVSAEGLVNLPNPNSKAEVLRPEADLGASLELWKVIREAFHEVTQIPEVASGKTENIGNLAGIALEILFGPATEKTEDKRETYGESLENLNRALLGTGFGTSDDFSDLLDEDETPLTFEFHWPSIVPADEEAEGRTLATDVRDLGVSKRTALLKRGYDPDLEETNRQKETEESARAFNVGAGIPQIPGRPVPVPVPDPARGTNAGA